MKSLHDYLLGVRKETKVKLRFAMVLTDEQVDMIETNLKKYDLISIGSPKKTIFQTRAIGFEDPINSEVTIIDVTLGLPVSSALLRLEMARAIKVSDARVAVDSEQDEAIKEPLTSQEPTEVETYVGKQTQIQPAQISVDAKDHYGSEYNDDMIKTLSDARKEAKKEITKKN